jgi:agmatine deiminase
MIQTPAELGYRHPAEWEPHAATWIGWPHNRTDWPGKLEPIHWVYGEIVRKIAPGELVRILVKSAATEARAQRVLRAVGVDLKRVEFLRLATNRGWTRDSGPIFVKKRDAAIVQFRFNAWAKYDDWKLDAKIPAFAARKLGCRIFNTDFVLEGGAIDTNGSGTLLTTEECLLDDQVQVRNPGLDRAAVEAKLRAYLGVRRIVWLGKGIAGDDTHGHVDDLCRFVNRDTVVLCGETSENHECLQGSGFEVVSLPMPAPLHFRGQRLPASYANFYVANAAVIVPTFNDPNDRVALGILGELFRDRPVVGIHAVDLVLGLGTLHCLTQQQPV